MAMVPPGQAFTNGYEETWNLVGKERYPLDSRGNEVDLTGSRNSYTLQLRYSYSEDGWHRHTRKVSRPHEFWLTSRTSGRTLNVQAGTGVQPRGARR
jgi:hypothetical protein